MADFRPLSSLGRATVLSPILLLCLVGVVAASPSQDAAIIDLRDWSFEQDGIATLDGDWEFYWQQLLEPADFAAGGAGGLPAGDGVRPLEDSGRPADHGEGAVATRDGLFSMPDIWNAHLVDGEGLGGLGFATFRVRVLLPPGMRRGDLRIPNASTAYRLWVNGAMLSQSGEPGVSREETTPRYRIRTAGFSAPSGALDLVLQVSNFHHRRGGMWRPIELGTVSQIESKDAVETAYDLLLIGSFFAMALYNVLLYGGSGKKHRSMLFLGLLFGVLSLRISVMGQMVATRLVPAFPWGLQLRIEYLTAMLALFAVTETLHSIYPRIIGPKLRLAVAIFVGLNAVLIIFPPLLFYSRIVQPLVYTMIAFLFLESILLLIALIRGRRQAAVGLGAAAITLFITLGETIHYQQLILSRDFAPLGFLITLIAGDSVNQTTAFLISTGTNLILVFFIANLLAVKGSRTLHAVQAAANSVATTNSVAAAAPDATSATAAADADGIGAGVTNPAGAERVRGGGSEHSPAEVRRLLKARFGVTNREADVIERLANGQTNKEIAAELFVSEATIKTHVHRILTKCDCGNRTEIGRLYHGLQAESSP